MKKTIFLFFLLVSVSCFAGDGFLKKNAPCPNGGYHPKEGLHTCCKDGFYFENHSQKYDGIQAFSCGCPDGGTPSETCKVVCCKDGYAFGENSPPKSYGSGKYDAIKPGCCCPFGGTRQGKECCKDGRAFNLDTNQYDLVRESCGCPDGGTASIEDLRGKKFCCKDGFMYEDETHSYSRVWGKFCGCPENGVPVQTGDEYDIECCKNGFRWILDSYSDFYPRYCGCPDGGELKITEKDKYGQGGWPYCCKDGYRFNDHTKTYSQIDMGCGCPEGKEEECEKEKMMEEKFQEIMIEFMTRTTKGEKIEDVMDDFGSSLLKAWQEKQEPLSTDN